MSGVSFLEKLLDGDGVDWKPLESCATIERGRRVTKSELSPEKKYPVFSGGVTPMGFYDDYNQKNNTITIVKYGTAGFVNFIEADFWANDVCYCIKPGVALNNKYLFYYLKRHQYDIQSLATDAIPAHLPTDAISTYEIPIPCPENTKRSLEIQAEIVRILDRFTELTAELTAELTTRRKQYNYYREQLLSFEEMGGEVEWKALGDIGEFIRGKRFTKADYVDEGISVIHYGEIYTRYGVWADHAFSKVRADMAGSLRYAEPGDVILTDVGETVDDVGKAVAWVGDNKVAIHDHCYAFRHSMNPKFVSYCMQTQAFIAKKGKYVARTKVNTLLINGFSKIEIPVPYPDDPERSLAEQTRIVAILDKFDALTNSDSEGLPREIELRQKQYEYYRDLLLSFAKPEEVAA
ncbi:restriction endonuclease subunit S [Burkholderia gladioli]|uniref:restriction endonuclease subunit S n=1 Tax=Burkholderia gladioli TaxID=28095 RepID=UPI0016416556|nr:restriction endonuclease subunit S [Burkholderia gladioli]